MSGLCCGRRKGGKPVNYLATHENKTRGTFDFPIEFHFVDPTHPRYWMPFHWHMESELILVLSGGFTLSLDTNVRELRAGDAAFVPDGSIHGGTPHDSVYECVVFDFSRFLQEKAMGGPAGRDMLAAAVQQPYLFERGSPACAIVGALFQAIEREGRGYEFTTVGLLWQLMGLLVRQAPAAPPARDKRVEQMKQVLRRIRRDYAGPLTLGELAAEADMAPKYFCRVFRQITGRTPIDYLNYYRVECAGERLCVTDESITDVALSCGFNDLSYFTRTFRKYKGVTAQRYRTAQGQRAPLL